MKIYSIYDEEFKEYGRVMEGYDTTPITEALETKTPCPDGVEYVAKEEAIQNLAIAKEIAPSLFGGLPVEFGWCNGHNTKLNCLEYHRCSEFNLGTEDFVLLLARQADLDEKFCLDTTKVKAFRVPKNVLVEVYASSLHYAPCQGFKDKGFRVLIALPEGTNVGTATTAKKTFEDSLMTASNKWLLAHSESSEAKTGAYIGLIGENIDIAQDLQ